MKCLLDFAGQWTGWLCSESCAFSSFWVLNPYRTWVGSVGMEWTFGLQKYGSEWRDGRKAFHHEFRPQVVHKFRPIETRGVHYLLRSLLKTPEDFMRHCQQYVPNNISC